MNETLRQKVISSIDFLGKSFYINQDNAQLKYKMESKDSVLKTTDVSLFSVLTYLSNGKQLITGTYGAGKTTVSEAISSIYNSLPIEIVSEGLLRCNPQLTEEKIIGRPDLGKLQQGIEKVVWTYFTIMPTNLIDEFNRMGADKQILLLDSIDRGNFKYLNEMIRKIGATYATKNELDGGNTELLPAIEDRFNIEVEVVPAVGYTNLINGEKKILSSKEIADKIRQKIKENNSLEGILSLEKEFQKKTNNLAFSVEEKDEIFKEIENIGVDKNSMMFLEYVFAEANFDPENGYKGQPINTKKNHNIKYLMENLKDKSSLSMRWKNSIINYAKSLAWLKGEESVTCETIKTILPYTLVNKLEYYVNPERKLLETNKTSNAKKVSKEIYQRFVEDSKVYESFEKMMANDNYIRKKIESIDKALTKKSANEKIDIIKKAFENVSDELIKNIKDNLTKNDVDEKAKKIENILKNKLDENLKMIDEWAESEHPYFEFFKAVLKKEANGDYD